MNGEQRSGRTDGERKFLEFFVGGGGVFSCLPFTPAVFCSLFFKKKVLSFLSTTGMIYLAAWHCLPTADDYDTNSGNAKSNADKVRIARYNTE